MLYGFYVVNSQYFKFGFTAQTNPWNRIQKGFWTNLHPMELRGKWGSQNLIVLHVFEGDTIWRNASRACSLLGVASFGTEHNSFVRLMTLDLEIPTRPDFEETDVDKLACCSGEWHECWVCNTKFKRCGKLLQHKRDVHESPFLYAVVGRNSLVRIVLLGTFSLVRESVKKGMGSLYRTLKGILHRSQWRKRVDYGRGFRRVQTQAVIQTLSLTYELGS